MEIRKFIGENDKPCAKITGRNVEIVCGEEGRIVNIRYLARDVEIRIEERDGGVFYSAHKNGRCIAGGTYI